MGTSIPVRVPAAALQALAKTRPPPVVPPASPLPPRPIGRVAIAGRSLPHFPLVSAIMLVADPRRVHTAKITVRTSFLTQLYPNKQLVIINSSGTPVLENDHPDCFEYAVDPLSIGEGLNLGVQHALGSWAIRWDDDDWSHPYRMLFQMSFSEPDHCVMLRHQIRLHYPQHTAILHDDPAGITNTMCWPRYSSKPCFPPGNDAVDAHYLTERYGSQTIVVGPEALGELILHVAFYHGLNATSAFDFMGPENVGDEHADQFHLKPWHIQQLLEAGRPYNIGFATKLPKSVESVESTSK